MLDSKKIIKLLYRLNEQLESQNIRAEIGIVGGAAMSLLFKDRAATKDVDAIFHPASEVRKIASEIAEEEGLPRDWLNDAVKGFLSEKLERKNFLSLSHLSVWIPPEQYLLAMKSISARFDSADRDDLIRLIRHLKLKDVKSTVEIVESYYPKKQIPAKTMFFLEEIFEEI